MADKSILEDMLELFTPEEQVGIKAKLAANPKLVAGDKFQHSLFGAYRGFEEGTEPAAVTPPAAAVHTPTVPSAAAAAAPPVVTPPAAAAAPSADNKAIMDLLTGINKRLDTVVTADQLPKLGADLVNSAVERALKQSNELSVIRETHREEFGEKLDTDAFEKFVNDNQDATTHRNKYATLTDAYNGMVGEKRIANKIATGVADGIKQKTSAASVPGQSQTTSLSPAQQVMLKAKNESAGGAKTNLQLAIDRAAALVQSRDAASA